MRFMQLPHALKVGYRFAVMLIAGACTLLPMNLAAQGKGFLVLPEQKSSGIWAADCPALKPDSPTQKVTCTLTQDVCDSGKCGLEKMSTDTPLRALTFGKSQRSPTCIYVFDWASYRYVSYPAGCSS